MNERSAESVVDHRPDFPFGCAVQWGERWAEKGWFADFQQHVCNDGFADHDEHICKCGAVRDGA